MNDRASFYDIENVCLYYYNKLGRCFHLCTPENHTIVFRNTEEFKRGMNIIGITAKGYPKVKILTFEVMSNHLHIVIAGEPEDILEFFDCLKKQLSRCLYQDGSRPDLNGFTAFLHEITSLENLRNAIAYANRNGSVIDRHVCPYTYPWGSNRYFFNPEATSRYKQTKRKATVRELRAMTLSRKYDSFTDAYLVDDYVCPLSFCLIPEAEMLFRDARHYFTKVSKHIESYDEIAKMIGEQIYYTDDDLFSIVCSLATKKFDCKVPSHLQKNDKIELAKILHREYNAGVKQIQRMLKIDAAILTALFGSNTK